MVQAKVSVGLSALCEFKQSFWRARAKLLIALKIWWRSVGSRDHVTDGKTNTSHRHLLIG